jgi:alpha-mannosidase
MRITGVASTDKFAGTTARPVQLIQVTLADAEPDAGPGPGPVLVRIEGPGVRTPEPAAAATGAGGELHAEVGVEIAAPYTTGSSRQVTVIAERGTGLRAQQAASITAAQTGWTMWMVSHFHYDPVWWSTQGQFTQARIFLPDADGRLPDVRTAFELVRLHLAAARQDPDYKFVLAEIDYLKPHFDAHPEDREDLLAFIKAGRIEIVGGSYNEPNTNLTCAESTIRNAVHGLGYQREMLGADPSAAWMLDAFGHDPGFPGLMAAAGLTESAWARGPFHQWGPNQTVGDNRRMQFAAEFEWLSPDGTGLLTSYMANHYGAGWATHQAASLAAAEEAAYQQFRELSPVAATRNVLLPVGADHVIPSRWATGIHRDWNARYIWPRFVTAVPSEFFAAVRKDAAERDVWITPQTRDMNPVYPGKDVSYIDTKQAQRAAEIAVQDGERLATLAWLAGADYPAESLDLAWRLLVFGAHHDAITGTEGDQVYLDLLAGWRDAYERGDAARRAAAGYLAGRADTSGPADPGGLADGLPVVVFNTLSFARSALVSVTLQIAGPGAAWVELRDAAGSVLPCLAEGATRRADGTLAGVTLTFRAADVPALGYRTYWAHPAAGPAARSAAGPAAGGGSAGQPGPAVPGLSAAGWAAVPGPSIENQAFLVTADPARGGTLAQLTDKRAGRELLAGPGHELVLQEEYAQHPRWGEGPWLISTQGPGTGSAAGPAVLRAERCPIGSRLVAEFCLGELQVRQETLLWDGSDRVEFRTHVDGSIGQDRLLRAAFPAAVAGGLPVYQTATAVIGRPPGSADTDVGQHAFTLDNPAHEWFGVGSTARVALTQAAGGAAMLAIGVAEVVAPASPHGLGEPVRELVVALARAGVTATCSMADGPRYGSIDVDSNLPDFRIALGGPAQNPFTRQLLAAASPAVAAELQDQLAAAGHARVWVPAAQSRAAAFAPGADLRGPRDLPVLIVAAGDLGAAIEAVAADLADAVIEVPGAPDGPGPEPALADYSVALLNRGTPGSLVTPDGVLYMSLMRACSAWPCGVWIDGDKRTVPDGSSFAWQHWSHTFEYALAAGPGDWRAAGFGLAGQDYSTDLLAVPAGRHGGQLPAAASLAGAAPATVQISALKPRGNPLAPGRPPRPADGITVRLRDVSGSPAPVRAQVRLRSGVTAAARTDLCEQLDGPAVPVSDGAAEPDLPPSGLVTLVLQTAPPQAPDALAAPGAPPAPQDALIPSTLEAPLSPSTLETPMASSTPEARPATAASPARSTAEAPDATEAPAPPPLVFSRYWLHGRGPAPAGNLPVAVHLTPARTALSQAEPAAPVRLTVACGSAPAAGPVRLAVPAGLTVDPPGPARYDLPSRGQAGWDLAVRAQPGARPGRYYLAAQIGDPAGRVVEDAVLVTLGEPPAPAVDLPLDQLIPLYLADQQASTAEVVVQPAVRELVVPPAGQALLEVTVTNATAAQIRGEAQLLSPFGSWDCVRPWLRGFVVEPGRQLRLGFTVRVPAAARPGQDWWALVKVMYFGQLRYTEPIAITIPSRSR